MAASIAALTAGGGGLQSSSDSSGNLDLKSGTTTIVALTSAGAAVTGTMSTTGTTTVAAGSAALPAIVSTTGTADTGLWFPAADTVAASTGGTERMRIDSSGNVGIGTSSPAYKLDVTGQGRATTGFAVSTDGSTFTPSGLNAIPNYGIGYITSTSQTVLSGFGGIPFYTNQVERARIDSSGNLMVAQTSQTSTEKFGVTQSATGSSAARFYASSASYTNDIVQISCARSGATTEYNAFSVFDNNTTLQMLIRPNGNLLNTNNSYGSLSDVNLKENIVDATPKLDGLMQVKVRNYNLKDDANKIKQIGVIAQELETVFPGMIETDGDGIKAVKYSVFVPMLIKAIQEQQSMITSLTARIAALEQL